MQTGLDDETVNIKFEGRIAEVLEMIDPKLYRPNIVIEKVKKVLYGELYKVLYGMITASLLFWQQVTEDLMKMGYIVNPYDWCLANKIVNGAQHTIGWHVYDFIMTHIDPTVNTSLIDCLQKKYGKLSPLLVHRGSTHDYPGMAMNFSQQDKVIVTMIDYIDTMLKEAPEEFHGEASSPAANHLFKIDDRAEKLDEDTAGIHHHMVAK